MCCYRSDVGGVVTERVVEAASFLPLPPRNVRSPRNARASFYLMRRSLLLMTVIMQLLMIIMRMLPQCYN